MKFVDRLGIFRGVKPIPRIDPDWESVHRATAVREVWDVVATMAEMQRTNFGSHAPKVLDHLFHLFQHPVIPMGRIVIF